MNRSPNLEKDGQAALAQASRFASMDPLPASIVHEMNQPICATLFNAEAALEWLSAPSPDIEEARLAVSRILKDCTRAVDVLRSIRSLVKKTPPRREDCRLNQTVSEVMELICGEASTHLVSVTTDLADRLPLVRGDPVQLQQVVLNLVMNAIEAMSDMIAGPRNLRIRTTSDATHAVVSVQDSGPGLDPATIDRIFEPYYTTKANGLGVGLSICRSIIDAHLGKLWAAQNEGRGATFSFSLPLDSRRPRGVHRSRKKPSPPA